MIAWFRTNRQLIARDLELSTIIAKQGEELEVLHAEFAEGWNRAVAEQNRLMRQRDDIRRNLGQQIRNQAATIADQRERLARVVDELKTLHAEIRRAELGDVIARETAAKRQSDGLGDPE